MGKIAYFSMEIGLESKIPTYSGGLGVLAGDHLKAAADLGLPMVGITLMYNRGYFEQHINEGVQTESYEHFDPSLHMEEVDLNSTVPIEHRKVKIKAWKYEIKGRKGIVPVYFIDTNGLDNRPWDEDITHKLYGGDHDYWRVAQEVVLGIGGVRMLHELGIEPEVYHLNEGHGAFATIELVKYHGYQNAKDKTVFTTHTPVSAGHDKFGYDLINQVLTSYMPRNIKQLAGEHDLNMTLLALNNSRYANGVARKHGEVSQKMFPDHEIGYITNGVHSFTWTSDAFLELYDKNLPDWRDDPTLLENIEIKEYDLLRAYFKTKQNLVDLVNDRTEKDYFYPEKLTIGFARRFATYKRASLIFSDLERLAKISNGNLQLVFAGKAHPMDEYGKSLIYEIHQAASALGNKVKIVFLEGYDMEMGKILTSGCDVWLNTPQRPREASGTSGMKAAHNANPHFSVNDGWWCETNIGGWDIGTNENACSLAPPTPEENKDDVNNLYNKLEFMLMPTFGTREWTKKKIQAIRNAGYFNSHRQVMDYVNKAYKLDNLLGKQQTY